MPSRCSRRAPQFEAAARRARRHEASKRLDLRHAIPMPRTTPKSRRAANPDYDAPGPPGEAPADAARVPRVHARAFGLVAITMNRFIVDHVVRAARQFDNDTETMILFGMLSHLNVAHPMPPGSAPSQALDADGHVPDAQPRLRPVRVRDLTLISGRPRETVRRKLEVLLAQGRGLRVDSGYVLNVASVDAQMQMLTLDGVNRFLDAARLMQDALNDAEQALAQGPAGAAQSPGKRRARRSTRRGRGLQHLAAGTPFGKHQGAHRHQADDDGGQRRGHAERRLRPRDAQAPGRFLRAQAPRHAAGHRLRLQLPAVAGGSYKSKMPTAD
jgi:hypothetical protein